jgi:hypothetical protein
MRGTDRRLADTPPDRRHGDHGGPRVTGRPQGGRQEPRHEPSVPHGDEMGDWVASEPHGGRRITPFCHSSPTVWTSARPSASISLSGRSGASTVGNLLGVARANDPYSPTIGRRSAGSAPVGGHTAGSKGEGSTALRLTLGRAAAWTGEPVAADRRECCDLPTSDLCVASSPHVLCCRRGELADGVAQRRTHDDPPPVVG